MTTKMREQTIPPEWSDGEWYTLCHIPTANVVAECDTFEEMLVLLRRLLDIGESHQDYVVEKYSMAVIPMDQLVSFVRTQKEDR